MNQHVWSLKNWRQKFASPSSVNKIIIIFFPPNLHILSNIFEQCVRRDSNIHQHSFPFREFVRVSLRFLVVVHGNSQLVFQHRQHWSESWSELTNIPLLFIDPIVSKGQHDIDLLFCWLSCVPCLQLFFHVWIPNCRHCIRSCTI